MSSPSVQAPSLDLLLADWAKPASFTGRSHALPANLGGTPHIADACADTVSSLTSPSLSSPDPSLHSSVAVYVPSSQARPGH